MVARVALRDLRKNSWRNDVLYKCRGLLCAICRAQSKELVYRALARPCMFAFTVSTDGKPYTGQNGAMDQLMGT